MMEYSGVGVKDSLEEIEMTAEEFINSAASQSGASCPGCKSSYFHLESRLVDGKREIRNYGGQYQQRLIGYYEYVGNCARCHLHFYYSDSPTISFQYKKCMLWYKEPRNTFDFPFIGMGWVKRPKPKNPWYMRCYGRDDVIDGAIWEQPA